MPARKRRVLNDDVAVKASILIGVRDHALWGAAAAMRRMDRSAFAVEAIRAACHGLILVDKRKPKHYAETTDRPDPAGGVNADAPDDAA